MRLITITALAISFAFSSAAIAQNADVDVYHMLGDVPKPASQVWEKGKPVTTSDLVKAAHPDAKQGTVFVFRGSPLQWVNGATVNGKIQAEALQPGVSGGTTLEPGDIVVYRSAPVAGENNFYADCTTGRVELHYLPRTSRFTFRQLGYGTGEVEIIRTTGETPGKDYVPVEEGCQDGDIVLSTRGTAVAPAVVSQAADTLPPPVLNNGPNVINPSVVQSAPVLPAHQPASGGLAVESSGSLSIDAGISNSPSVVLPAENTFDSLPFSEDVPAPTDIGFAQPPTQVAMLDNGGPLISSAPQILEADQLEFRADASAPTDSSNAFPADSETTEEPTPKAVITDSAPTVTPEEESSLNGIFLLGLILAGILIVVGWMKTRGESQEEAARTFSMIDSISGAPEIEDDHGPDNSDGFGPSGGGNSPNVSSPTPSGLVQSMTDSGNSTSLSEDDCPVLSAGLDETKPESQSQQTQQQSQPPGDAQLFTEAASSAADSPGELIDASEFYGKDWEETPTENIQAVVEDDPFEDTEIELERPETVVSGEESLTELIENRLPLELSQPRLPLRVTLFGKAAGPQRLRIDGSQTEISAPHMLARNRKPQQAPAAATSTAQTAKPTGEATGQARFDNALNSLDQREQA